MYIVKDDNPDVGFTINAGEVKDSEGNVITDADVDVFVESDNPQSVEVIMDETGKAGKLHFGSPGLANINATVEDADGVMLGSFGAQFTITTGDAASVTGGTITFDGLTEA